MQILVPKWRIQSTTPFISSSFVAYFRSSPTSSEKWKNKWFHPPDSGHAKPSKTFIRYKTRQKRADAKKALNDIYFGSGSSKFTLERWTKSWDDDPTEHKNRKDPSARRWWDDDPAEHKNRRDPSARRWWDDDPAEHKNRRDPYARRWDDDPTENRNRRDSKAHQKRKKNKWKRANDFEIFDDDEDDPDKHFQATFGNRRYSWSFKSWEESFSQSKKSGCKYSNTRNKWRTVSDDDESSEDDDFNVVGSHSDRVALGLPTNGPLKIEEVKNAFRLSALKWHPDKYQGPSQAMAEEKFKLCASAYKSLCNALSQV